MKRVKSTVTYVAPNWNFCNSDNLIGGELTEHKCQFCQKTKEGYKCMLYATTLQTEGEFIKKTRECCKATAGFPSHVDVPAPPSGPVIPPKELMQQAIDLYTKTLNDLICQGYPHQIAAKAARDYVVGKP